MKNLVGWTCLGGCMAFVLSVSCAKSNDSGSREKKGAPSAAAGASGSGTLVVQAVAPEGVEQKALAGAKLLVEDQPELEATADANGRFAVDAIQPGTLNVMVVSQPQASLTTSKSFGFKIDDIVIKANETNDLGERIAAPTGSITGKVAFFENPNKLSVAGSDVFVPGYSGYSVKTGDDGAFTISDLAAGTYEIYAQHDGFAVLKLTEVVVASGESTDLGVLSLSLSNGPEGGIAIREAKAVTINSQAASFVSSRTVAVGLQYDTDAALMKISDEPSFLNKSWEPVQPTKTWAFAADGAKELYVMYSDLNGLESSPYSVRFYVDTEAPTISAFSLLHNWSQISATATKIDISLAASDSGTGVSQMMLSNLENFSTNSGWLTYSTAYGEWIPATNTWVKVRDFAGNESTVLTDSINFGIYTIIQPDIYQGDLTLRQELSPYRFEDSVSVLGDFVIKPGVTLDINLTNANKTFSVAGKTEIVGTDSAPVVISSSGLDFGGFDLTNSTSDDNVIAYLNIDIDSSGGYQTFTGYGAALFLIDGGIMHHNNITVTGIGKVGLGLVQKHGYRTFTFENNIVNGISNGVVDIKGGTGATRIEHNHIIANGDYVLGLSGGTGTLIRYNTLVNFNTGGGADGSQVILSTGGTAAIDHNVMSGGIGSSTSSAIRVNYLVFDPDSVIDMAHNNIDVPDDSLASHVCHGGTNVTLNSDHDYYGGCAGSCSGSSADNPTVIGSFPLNASNVQATAWPTAGTKASGCVGHLCLN